MDQERGPAEGGTRAHGNGPARARGRPGRAGERPNREELAEDPRNRRWLKVMGISLIAAVGGALLIRDLLLPDCEHDHHAARAQRLR